MAKIALLVGVSEYQPGLNPLPAAVKDLDAMREVLVHPDIGGFAESDVTLLKNPNRQVMEEAIYTLFADRQKGDLLLFFFSGHGIRDDNGILYLATGDTRKTPQGDLIRPTAVSANSVHESMDRSRSKRQIVILDSCFSGAFAEGMSAKDDSKVDVRNQLGGEGRAVLTSSSSTQYSFEQEGEDLSLYSRFLIEGLKTGEADLDRDEVVSIDELHEYASKKVREVKPEMNPEIYAIREGYKIRLAKVPPGDPVEKYRKEVARFINRGEISLIGRSSLDWQRKKLGLEATIAKAIEDEVLKPVRKEFREKLQRYEQIFTEVVQREETLGKTEREQLQYFQQSLGLRNEDTMPIEAKVTAQFKAHKQHLQEYEQAFHEALRQEYPLTATKRVELQQMQQRLELTDQDTSVIEERITTEVETHHRNLQQYKQAFNDAVKQEYPLSEAKRGELRQYQQVLSLTDVDVTSIEAQITTEIETYQKKLQQYEQALVKATQCKHPLNEVTHQQLQQTWQTLGLNETDVTAIETQINDQIKVHQTNMRRYEQAFADVTEQQYPLSEATLSELRQRQQVLNLTDEDIAPIETKIITEIEDHIHKLGQYEQVLAKYVNYEYPLSEATREELQRFQQILELRDEDIAQIEAQITAKRQQEQEEHESKLRRYKQEFSKAVQGVFPLSEAAQDELQAIQQSLELTPEDVEQIEQPIRIKAEAKYQEKLRQEAEQRQQEQEKAEYENKLRRYEQEFSRAAQAEYPLNQFEVGRLKEFQQELGLKDEDVAPIQKREHQRYAYHLVQTKVLVGASIAILCLSGIAIWVINGQAYHPQVIAKKPEIEIQQPKPKVEVQPKPKVGVLEQKVEVQQPKPEGRKQIVKIQQPKPKVEVQPKPKVGVLEQKVEVQQLKPEGRKQIVKIQQPKQIVKIQQPKQIVKIQQPKQIVKIQQPTKVLEVPKLAFENLPVLTHVYTNNNSATNSYARYFFEVNIPQNSGAPLGGLTITIPPDITVPSSGNISVTDNTGQPIAFKLELQQRTVLLTFSQPVSPGQKITVQFYPMSNPIIGGTFQFEIFALPAGSDPHAQRLGFGSLTFYRGGQ